MCFFCKGDLKEGLTTYPVTIENNVIVIKNVPCEECVQCGEKYFSDDTMQKLESIIDCVKNAISEVTIVDYRNQVA